MLRGCVIGFVVGCLAWGSACVAEKQIPPLCGGTAERCVVPGFSSAARCDETGQCVGTNDSCSDDRDCFYPIENGADVPTWDRPQGGLGTRLNLRLEGFAPTQQFSTLQTIVLGARQSPTDDAGDDEETVVCEPTTCSTTPEDCPCDAAAGFSCIQLPKAQAICAEVICNQVNRRFPLEADPFDAWVVPELPVRFQNDFGLEDLNGREVMLYMSVSLPNDDVEAAVVPTTLAVGDFIKPSWWEE